VRRASTPALLTTRIHFRPFAADLSPERDDLSEQANDD
jgi:hypothetical protein